MVNSTSQTTEVGNALCSTYWLNARRNVLVCPPASNSPPFVYVLLSILPLFHDSTMHAPPAAN